MEETTEPVEQEWQEILDPNTNCYYYWNSKTNEVTWEAPAAYKPPTTAPTEAADTTRAEKEPTLLEKLTRQEPDSSGAGKDNVAEKEKEDSETDEEAANSEPHVEVSAGAIGGIVGYDSPEEDNSSHDESEKKDEEEEGKSETEMEQVVKQTDEKEVLGSEENKEEKEAESKKEQNGKPSREQDERSGKKISEGKSNADDDEDDDDLSRYQLFDDDEDENDKGGRKEGGATEEEEDEKGEEEEEEEEDVDEDVEDIDKQLEEELEQKKV